MPGDIERLIEEIEQRHYGKYRGVVVDNEDPLGQGRVSVKVPSVLGEQVLWALPCTPYAGPGIGWFGVPPTDARVWVEFEGGHRNHPIWAGCFWGEGELPDDAGPDVVLLRTPGAVIRIEESGTVEVETSGGAKLVLSGSEITMEAPAIRSSANGGVTELSAAGFDAMNGALKVI